MLTYRNRRSTEDRPQTGSRLPWGLDQRAERRTSEAHDRRVLAQTERVGSSLIVVTSFD